MTRLAIKRLTSGLVFLLTSSGLVALVALGQPSVKDKTPTRDKAASAKVQLMPGAWVSWELGAIEATGSSAADLFAPSADVARIKAERLARLRATERLRKALTQLCQDEKQRSHLAPFGGAEQVAKLDVERARVLTIDHASSGSVSLRLSLPLTVPPPAAADLGVTTVDGGAEPAGASSGAGRGAGE